MATAFDEIERRDGRVGGTAGCQSQLSAACMKDAGFGIFVRTDDASKTARCEVFPTVKFDARFREGFLEG